MKFGATPVSDGEGWILAQAIKVPGLRLMGAGGFLSEIVTRLQKRQGRRS